MRLSYDPVREGRHQDRRAANLGLTAVVFLLNWSLSSMAAILALAVLWPPPAVARRLGLPMSVQIVAGILILDYSAGYLAHRALHLFPVLWRFHRVNHSDDFVDVTTTYRTHPVETVWRSFFVIVPVWMIGIPALAVVIQRFVSAANGIFEHSNTRLWGPLGRVLSLVWGDAQRPQDSSLPRARRNELELRQRADDLRPDLRNLRVE